MQPTHVIALKQLAPASATLVGALQRIRGLHGIQVFDELVDDGIAKIAADSPAALRSVEQRISDLCDIEPVIPFSTQRRAKSA